MPAVTRMQRMAAPAALATTVVLWASAFAAIREAVRALGWAHLSVLRLGVAALALGALAAVRRVGWPARRDLPLLALCALSGMTAYQVLLNAGEVTVPAATASLLVNVAPIFTALLAASLLGERLTAMGWCGVVLGFAGAGLIAVAAGGGVRLSGGALLVLSAAAAQATFFVSQKALLGRYGEPRGHRVGDGSRGGDGPAAGAGPGRRRERGAQRCAAGRRLPRAGRLGPRLPDLGLRGGARRRHRRGEHALRGAAGGRARRRGSRWARCRRR